MKISSDTTTVLRSRSTFRSRLLADAPSSASQPGTGRIIIAPSPVVDSLQESRSRRAASPPHFMGVNNLTLTPRTSTSPGYPPEGPNKYSSTPRSRSRSRASYYSYSSETTLSVQQRLIQRSGATSRQTGSRCCCRGPSISVAHDVFIR